MMFSIDYCYCYTIYIYIYIRLIFSWENLLLHLDIENLQIGRVWIGPEKGQYMIRVNKGDVTR